MLHKSIPLTIKAADDNTGTFTGYASVFDNVDAHGDIVRRGAFAKSIASGASIPLLWEHGAADPRNYVGDVVQAAETDTGLEITGKFDLDSEHGAAAYRNVKGRRVKGLSIGYRVDKSVKTDAGNELLDVDLIEVSIVARGANDRALVGAVKSAGQPTAPIRSALARATAARIITEQKADTPMSNIRATMLTKTRDEALTSIKTLLDAADAEGRDLTTEESAEIESLTKSVGDCDTGLTQLKSDAAVTARARELADAVGAPSPSTPAQGGYIAMTGKHAKALAAKVIAAMPRDPASTKALAAGQQTTSTIVLPEVVAEGRPAVSLLDVLPMRMVAPSYSFLRQVSPRSNNAAPVAELALKPTTPISVQAVENRLRVIAHVSEQIPTYLVSDSVNLERFVADELLFGLRRALENQIVNGNGSGENFTGILNTSGIQSQSFATDALTSIRKGLTRLDALGYTASVIALSAATWEGIELLTATAGATDRAVPVDPVARRLWGTRVVLNQSLASNRALLIGEGAVTIDTDGVIDTRWSDAVGEDFLHNAVRCRVESRFGLSVNQPGAVVAVTTASGGGSGGTGATA